MCRTEYKSINLELEKEELQVFQLPWSCTVGFMVTKQDSFCSNVIKVSQLPIRNSFQIWEALLSSIAEENIVETVWAADCSQRGIQVLSTRLSLRARIS